MSKSNSILKYFKIINKTINSLLEKNLNKLKLNNLINLARSNKIILSFVAFSFFVLTYLLLPTFYKQSDISKELNTELLNRFNLDFSFSQNLNYNFFPRPHFSSQDVYISSKQDKVSEIKKIKIYVSLENLFSLKNMKVKEVIISDANFNLTKKQSDFFVRLLDNNFIDCRLKIINSNIFFRDKENDVLFINKISKMEYFYETNELKNTIHSENEIFNVPYSIEFYKNKREKKFISKLKLDFLKLQIENQHNYTNKIKEGSAIISYNKSKSIMTYKKDQNFFEFNLSDKLDNPRFNYEGKVNFKPFYSVITGDTEKLDLSYLFDLNSIIPQLIKTEIFNNKNIDFKLSIKADEINYFKSFMNMILNAKIQEGLIDIDESSFNWKNYATFKLSDNLIYLKNNELILDGKSKIIINDYNGIYTFLVTPKNLRKKLKTIDLNYVYNFDQNIMKLENIRIDDKFDQNVNKTISDITIKNNDLQNKIYFKNFLNDVIRNYAG